jgi:hypothetical protein
MRSSFEQSRASPAVPISDPLVEDVIGASRRDATVRVSPRTARAADGKSLLPFWRRWWRSL